MKVSFLYLITEILKQFFLNILKSKAAWNLDFFEVKIVLQKVGEIIVFTATSDYIYYIPNKIDQLCE